MKWNLMWLTRSSTDTTIRISLDHSWCINISTTSTENNSNNQSKNNNNDEEASAKAKT